MKRIQTISLLFLASLCLAAAGLWIYNIINYSGYPQMEYSEGLIMFLGKQFAAGSSSWQIAQVPPYVVNFYPPVYYGILGQLINIFGDSLIVGRMLNLAAAALICVLIYLIAKKLTGNTLISVLGALIPLTQPVFTNWSFIVRTDMMAVMFELVAIYLVLRYENSRWQLLSIIFLLLALYTKQSTVCGAGAVCLYLIIRNWRQGLKYTAALVIIGAGIFVAANWATNGGFYNEVILYQRTFPTFKAFSDSSILVGYTPLIPFLVLAGVFIVSYPKHLLSIFAVMALTFNLVMNFRLGASHVYMIEVIAAVCLIAPVIISELVRKETLLPFVPALIIPALFLANSFINPIFPDKEFIAEYSEVKAIIADATYPVLSENVQVVLDAGKQPYLIDPFVFRNLTIAGYWDEAPLIEDLESGRIQYVITERTLPRYDSSRFTVKVQDTIVQNYRVDYSSVGADMPSGDLKSAGKLVVYIYKGGLD